MHAGVLQAKQRAKAVPARAFPQHEGSSLVDVIEQMRGLGINGAGPEVAERQPEANGDHSVADGLDGGSFPSGKPGLLLLHRVASIGT